MDFGRQVGVENRAKIDPKRHRKSDEKKKVNLGRLGRVLGRFKRQKRSAVARFGALLWPGEHTIIFEERNLTELYRSPASGPRHAAGLLRARCGSKAQQSCVSATALEQKIMRGLSIRINQKSRKKMIEPIKYQSKIDRKSIENQSNIYQKSIKKGSKSKLGGDLGGFWLPSASWEACGVALVRF